MQATLNDITRETVLGLDDAVAAVQAVISGWKPNPDTLRRWMKHGIGGVKLEHGRLGHRIITSREAISRFAARLALQGGGIESRNQN